jgi:glycerol kinase
MLQVPVERPKQIETTVLGAAYLAGLQIGWFKDLQSVAELWQSEVLFNAKLEPASIDKLYSDWQRAVKRVLT